MLDVCIRLAADSDLPRLAGTFGQRHFFAERLGRHRDGRGILLVALLGDEPVGVVYLWLESAEEPEIRERLPGVPLLQHLEVRESQRNRRIGSALVRTAERYLRRSGHKRVALGVRPDNEAATRLYLRLGYEEWAFEPIETMKEEFLPDGERHWQLEMCRIFVKDLVTPEK